MFFLLRFFFIVNFHDLIVFIACAQELEFTENVFWHFDIFSAYISLRSSISSLVNWLLILPEVLEPFALMGFMVRAVAR